MGAGIFLLLFLLGGLLSLVGSLIGVVDAFQVSPVWGLLALFIPFALIVFWVKFFRSRKWARNSLFISLAGLLSAILGIPFLLRFVNQQMANAVGTFETEVLEQIPVEPMPAPTGDAEVFAEPLVPAAPSLIAVSKADLIRSTDPNERLQQINSSRPDPFATVPIPPPPQVAPPPPPTSPVATTTSPAPVPAPASVASPPAGAGAPGQGGGSGVALAPLPPLPQPTQAEAVVVTGVVSIGGRNYAIVQTPDEPTGRYVAAGQRVAGGQVLVKRIDMRGNEPVVVLEQNGIEISRSVGLPPEPETTTAAI